VTLDSSLAEPKRVVVIVPQLEPVGGMERATTRVIKLLGDLRPQVILLSGRIPDELVAENSIETLGIRPGPARLLVAAIKLRRILRQPGAGTVVLAVGLWAAIPTLLVARTPVIVWEHSLVAERVSVDRRVRLLAQLARRLYRRAALLVAVSEPSASFLQALVPERPAVSIPNLVDLTEQSTFPKSEDPTIACVGGLLRVKNVELLVRALAYLPAEIRAVVAGSGKDLRRLERLARSLGLDERISFLGYVDDPRSIIGAAHVFAHPSLSETFGLAMLEAAACGTPVVALDRSTMRTLVPEAVPGLLVSEATPRAFAAGLQAALDKDWPQATFADAAKHARQLFGTEPVRHSWLAAFDRLSLGGNATTSAARANDGLELRKGLAKARAGSGGAQ
jgi:glycosyltransferase involved in cell wall biosynthesis